MCFVVLLQFFLLTLINGLALLRGILTILGFQKHLLLPALCNSQNISPLMVRIPHPRREWLPWCWRAHPVSHELGGNLNFQFNGTITVFLMWKTTASTGSWGNAKQNTYKSVGRYDSDRLHSHVYLLVLDAHFFGVEKHHLLITDLLITD